MNYYKRHLGDYAKDTKTISIYEHGVYTVVLDYYYSEEGPVSDEDVAALCRPQNAKERASVDKVMRRYFKKDGGVWRHSYADRVIAEWQEKSHKAAQSADKRWHGGQEAFAMRPICDGNASHKPVASNQEKTDLSGKPDGGDFETWYKAYPRHEGRFAARKAWDGLRKVGKLRPLAEMLAQMEWQRREGCLKPASADGRSLIPLPASYLNGGRFLDEPPKVYEPPPRQITPCRVAGCKAEGAPVWQGACAVHWELFKPARSAA